MTNTAERSIAQALASPLEYRWLHNPSGFMEASISPRFDMQVWHSDLKTVEKDVIIQSSNSSFMTCLHGYMQLKRVIVSKKKPLSFLASLANNSEYSQTFHNQSPVVIAAGGAWFNPEHKFYSFTSIDKTGVIVMVENKTKNAKPNSFWLPYVQTHDLVIAEGAISPYVNLFTFAAHMNEVLASSINW